MKKFRFFSFLLIVFSEITSFSQIAIAPAAGDGTESQPYQITSLENLYWIAEDPSRWDYHYIQTNNIDATETMEWNSGEGWVPIGNPVTHFTGSYNGKGNIIQNLYINRSFSDQGFFGETYNAKIDSIGLENITIYNTSATSRIGGLIGRNYYSKVNCCFTTGKITSSSPSYEIGGLIGYNYSAEISYSYSGVSVTGINNVGGLIGLHESGGVITNLIFCYATGNIKGSARVGGLIGEGSGLAIQCCYSTGNVEGKEYVGGCIGSIGNSTVDNSYSVGKVEGSKYVGGHTGHINGSTFRCCFSTGEVNGLSSAGGFAGTSYYPVVRSCFWDIETSGLTTSAEGMGLTSVAMKNVASYTDYTSPGLYYLWDFTGNPCNDIGTENYWDISARFNDGYPFLSWQEIPLLPTVITSEVIGINSITATANGYLTGLGISDPAQYGFCWNTTGSPIISDDKTIEGSIAVTGSISSLITGLSPNTIYYIRAYATNEEGTGYGEVITFTTIPMEPILPEGLGTSEDPYRIESLGNLLWIELNSQHWDKNYIQTADINASVTLTWNNSAGWIPPGNEIDYFTGSYNGQGFKVSNLYINQPEKSNLGFLGCIKDAIIENLGISDIDFSGKDYIGGITGNSINSVIRNCNSSGKIIGEQYLGGLAGSLTNSSVADSSYSTCEVKGNNYIGGLAGNNITSSNIKNSYFIGAVNGSSLVGGLTGMNSAIINNSFYNTDIILINGNNLITPGALFNEQFTDWFNNDLSLDIVNYFQKEGDYYLIQDISDLKNLLAFGDDPEFKFLLTCDIDMNNEVNFYIPSFKGTFDGRGYMIRNLVLDLSLNNNIGFFGEINGGKIENLGVIDITVRGRENTGGLAGYISDSAILSYCFTTGNINGFRYAGGLAGLVNNSSVINCNSSADVSGDSYCGGLSGQTNNSSIIQKCYSSGIVNGTGYLGGLIGENKSASLSNCYSTSHTTGDNYIGGLIGVHWSSSVVNCLSTGKVTGTNGVGGLIAISFGTVNNSFWDTETSGINISGAGTGKTTQEMKNVVTFTSLSTSGLTVPWDFTGNPNNDTGNDDIWNINNRYNTGYPYLNSQVIHSVPVISDISVTDITSISASGDYNIAYLGDSDPVNHGMCWNTTGIPTIEDYKTEEGSISETGLFKTQLFNLTTNTKYFIRAYVTDSEGTKYSTEITLTTLPVDPVTPEGSGTSADPYLIANLDNLYWLSVHPEHWNKYFYQTAHINASGSATWNNGKGWIPVGINNNKYFSGHYNGNGYSISGIYIDRPDEDFQGFFGYTSNAIIDNLSIIDGEIKGKLYTGGLVGFAYNTTISNCSTENNISGEARIGGITGYATNTKIENCSSSGSFIGISDIGGLAGKIDKSSVINCYSKGNLNGIQLIGGLIGSSYSSTLMNTYSACFNEIDTLSFNGLIGTNLWSTVTASFWDIDISGQMYSSGGIGKSTPEMKTITTFTDAGWDFLGETINGTDDYWGIQPDINDGYPHLDCQFYYLPVVKTDTVTEISITGATMYGEILDLGYPYPYQHGFCWNLTGLPTFNDSKTEKGPVAETVEISSVLNELLPKTTYYARAYATNKLGTVYGDEISFTTDSIALTIEGNFTVLNKKYDGTTNAIIENNNLTLPGLIEGDDVKIKGTAIFENPYVGEGKTVFLIGLALSGNDAYKYFLSFEDTLTTLADIYPDTVYIGGSFTAKDKVYDGNDTAEIAENNLVLTGIIEPDDVILTNIGLIFTNQNPGTDIPVVIGGAGLSGEDAFNYALSLAYSPVTHATIHWPPIYNLSIDIQGHGKVIVNDTAYNEYFFENFQFPAYGGTEVHLVAEAYEGYVFTGWTGDIISENTNETIIMDKDKSIIAVFTLNTATNTLISTDLQVFPNPFTNIINISYTGGIRRIILTTITGEVLIDKNSNYTKNESFSTETLKEGFYFVTVYTLNERKLIHRIIKY